MKCPAGSVCSGSDHPADVAFRMFSSHDCCWRGWNKSAHGLELSQEIQLLAACYRTADAASKRLTRWRDGFRQPADIFSGKFNKFSLYMHTERKKILRERKGRWSLWRGVLADEGNWMRANSNKNWSSIVNLFHAWWSGCMTARSGQCGLALQYSRAA